MKISQLPPEIKEKAIAYREKFNPLSKTDNLQIAFSWKKTNEGFEYWKNWDAKKENEIDLKHQLQQLNQLYTNSPNFTNQNIYITSDEDINENDYIITKDGRLVQVSYLLSKDLQGASKVILTTDTKLIADGVQPIPDEFLEWFVKNPSCERVEVKKGFADGSAYGYDFLSYKIIIPKVSKPTSMENKTPMQELIEYIELNQPKNKITDGIWSKAKSLLEKEKELILNTFIDGEVNCGRQLAKDYYNEKFKNNEN